MQNDFECIFELIVALTFLMCVVCSRYQYSFLMFYIILLFSYLFVLFSWTKDSKKEEKGKKETKKIKIVKARIKF